MTATSPLVKSSIRIVSVELTKTFPNSIEHKR